MWCFRNYWQKIQLQTYKNNKNNSNCINAIYPSLLELAYCPLIWSLQQFLSNESSSDSSSLFISAVTQLIHVFLVFRVIVSLSHQDVALVELGRPSHQHIPAQTVLNNQFFNCLIQLSDADHHLKACQQVWYHTSLLSSATDNSQDLGQYRRTSCT